jgi:pimeloyl-ACP methyl ester carboxylesterase
MGATVAIRMTALYPAQCKGLFLISLLPPVEVRAGAPLLPFKPSRRSY